MTQREPTLSEISREIRRLERQVSMLTQLLRVQKNTLVSLDEASILTGYAKGYLYKLTSSGELPCYRPTKRRVFIEREELEKWIRGAGK